MLRPISLFSRRNLAISHSSALAPQHARTRCALCPTNCPWGSVTGGCFAIRWHARCTSPDLGLIHVFRYAFLHTHGIADDTCSPYIGEKRDNCSGAGLCWAFFWRATVRQRRQMSGCGRGYPHYVTYALSNKPKRGGATRPRPEIHFVGV